MSKRPKIGVCICIVRDGKILLHKRKGGHSPGFWAFPGGHLEYGESFEDAALREMAEEAGPLKVTKPEFWTVANTVYKDAKKHFVCIFMKATWISGEAKVMEPSKCERWEWFPWTELPEPLMLGIQDLRRRGELP